MKRRSQRRSDSQCPPPSKKTSDDSSSPRHKTTGRGKSISSSASRSRIENQVGGSGPEKGVSRAQGATLSPNGQERGRYSKKRNQQNPSLSRGGANDESTLLPLTEKRRLWERGGRETNTREFRRWESQEPTVRGPF